MTIIASLITYGMIIHVLNIDMIYAAKVEFLLLNWENTQFLKSGKIPRYYSMAVNYVCPI